MGKLVWKILAAGSAAIAALVATKVVDRVWQRAGQDTTLDPKNPQTPLVKAIGYATLSGLAAGGARTLATRKAAAYYAKSAGHLPAALSDAALKDTEPVDADT